LDGKIIVLPDSLTSKIAAGEVVERPASILKELLENALDAGATDISIELEKGGCASIKVVDNGSGIESPQVPLAFERFATSKIYEFDDIYKVRSYGFRGEALPSIAAISRVEMVTRPQSSLSGTRVIVEAGQVKTMDYAGCPVGTSVLVNHIFDPVPVRKKFLKTEVTEQAYCMDVITRMALSHPEVRIKVAVRGREILNIPATRDIAERISLVLGTDFSDRTIPVKGRKASIALTGFASKPEHSRSSTKHIYFYVNKRFVKDYLLNHAVRTAYRHVIESKRYPAAVIFVDLPTEDVDVNVHPAKMEVRFRNPRSIYDIVSEALVSALSAIGPGVVEDKDRLMPDGYSQRVQEALRRYTISTGSGKLFFGKSDGDARTPGAVRGKYQDNNKDVAHAQISPDGSDGEQEIAKQRPSFADLEYIGQIAGTYLVFSSTTGMILMDQHAAHERILFEKFKKGSPAPGDKMIGQTLLIPEVVNLSSGECAALLESIKIMEDTGIEVELFGEKTVIIKSVPAMLSHIEPGELLHELLEEFSKTEKLLGLEERKEKIWALLACKGAVKANQELSEAEVEMLCRNLDATPFPSTCPHGRPVFISFKTGDLERMFKRK
jgi:DNA mismatch repair protein MutL